MPHSLSPQITLGEFVDRAVNNYQAREFRDKANSPSGSIPIRCLIRIVNTTTKIAQLPDIGDNEELQYDVVRNLCISLGIPPEDFGVPLDLSLINRAPDDEDDD